MIYNIEIVIKNIFIRLNKNINMIINLQISLNEIINLIVSDKNMGLYELNKKITVARQRGYTFDQINKSTITSYSNQSNKNIHYYLKLQTPIMHRHLFEKLSQNPEYVQTHRINLKNPFRFACREWYLYNIPQ